MELVTLHFQTIHCNLYATTVLAESNKWYLCLVLTNFDSSSVGKIMKNSPLQCSLCLPDQREACKQNTFGPYVNCVYVHPKFAALICLITCDWALPEHIELFYIQYSVKHYNATILFFLVLEKFSIQHIFLVPICSWGVCALHVAAWKQNLGL